MSRIELIAAGSGVVNVRLAGSYIVPAVAIAWADEGLRRFPELCEP